MGVRNRAHRQQGKPKEVEHPGRRIAEPRPNLIPRGAHHLLGPHLTAAGGRRFPKTKEAGAGGRRDLGLERLDLLTEFRDQSINFFFSVAQLFQFTIFAED